MYFLQFMSAPAAGTLDVLDGRTSTSSGRSPRLSLLAGAIVLAGALHLPPLGAVALLSVSGCITYALYTYSAWRAIVSYRPRDGGGGTPGPEARIDLIGAEL